MITQENHMGIWLTSVIRPQLARYNSRMAAVSPYLNSPRWKREHIAAQNEYHISTAEARALYGVAMTELAVDGEISEATDLLLTRFSEREASQLEAAE